MIESVYKLMIYEVIFKYVIIFLIVLAVLSLFKIRKSREYRKLITDMYVAAKTRFLAKEDDLDLEAEEMKFKQWEKKRKTEDRTKDLDDTIEKELKERVSEPTKKETKKEAKK